MHTHNSVHCTQAFVNLNIHNPLTLLYTSTYALTCMWFHIHSNWKILHMLTLNIGEYKQHIITHLECVLTIVPMQTTVQSRIIRLCWIGRSPVGDWGFSNPWSRPRVMGWVVMKGLHFAKIALRTSMGLSVVLCIADSLNTTSELRWYLCAWGPKVCTWSCCLVHNQGKCIS